MLQTMKKVSKQPELSCGVGQNQALAALPSGRFDQNVVTQLGDINGYLSLTLAAYVGEDATIRFDPRDMGEIRVFYKDRFLCRAISAELAGETIPLRDVIRVRNQRRKELRSILHDRQKMVDTLLQLKQGPALEESHVPVPVPASPTVRIKRYRNE
jgi:putative transposase